jgi:hypothetical protein
MNTVLPFSEHRKPRRLRDEALRAPLCYVDTDCKVSRRVTRKDLEPHVPPLPRFSPKGSARWRAWAKAKLRRDVWYVNRRTYEEIAKILAAKGAQP